MNEQEKQQRQLRALAKLEQEKDLETLLTSDAGKRFVWNLLDQSGTFGASLSGDAVTLAFDAGRRATGVALLNACLRLQRKATVEMLCRGFLAIPEPPPAPEPELEDDPEY